jgi:lysophospholipase L1-like esterase
MKLRMLPPILVIVLAATLRAADAPKFELKPGDRVALVGNTFVEREQAGDYIETMFASRFPAADITFRNLGYSADTVTGSARGLCTGWSTFEEPEKAFARLRKLVADYKPTVMILNYGMTESFFGPNGIAEFTANYNKMIDALSESAGTSPRILLLSPNHHEDLGRPLPDPTEHNRNLKLYADAVSSIATKRGIGFVDLYALTDDAEKAPPRANLTSNGIHLTPYGYWRVAIALEHALGYSPRDWNVEIDASSKAVKAAGTKISDAQTASESTLRFTATDDLLAPPPPPIDSPASVLDGSVAIAGTARVLKVSGLPPGSYELKAGEEIVARGSAEQWAKGIALSPGPSSAQADALRKMLIAKDFNFFTYQRPDNDAYILAFRKHEQGKNAGEIPQFLPLVAEKEKQLAELRSPRAVTYTLTLAK